MLILRLRSRFKSGGSSGAITPGLPGASSLVLERTKVAASLPRGVRPALLATRQAISPDTARRDVPVCVVYAPTSFPHWKTILREANRLLNCRHPKDLQPGAKRRQPKLRGKWSDDHVFPCILPRRDDGPFLQAPPTETGVPDERATDELPFVA